MKALRAEIELMKEDTIRIVKDVQDQCIQSLVDLSANFNSGVDLIRNEFQAIMRVSGPLYPNTLSVLRSLLWMLVSLATVGRLS